MLIQKENLPELEYDNSLEWIEYLKDAPIIKFANMEKDRHQDWHGLHVETGYLEGLTNMEEFTPDYSAWTTKNIERFIDDCINEGVKVIISSLLIKNQTEEYIRAFRKAKEHNIFIFNAMGNDRDNLDDNRNIVHVPHCIGVGAVHLDERRNRPKLASYSNYGMSVDFVDFAHLVINGRYRDGTSFSHNLAKKATLFMKYFEKHNINYDYDIIYNLLLKNSKNLGDKIKFGNGIVIMPNLEKFKEEVNEMSEPKQIRDLEELEPNTRKLCKILIAIGKTRGIDILITETYRTQERQNYLYSIGRTIRLDEDIKTKTLNSKHTLRKAFDFVPLTNGKPDWKDLKKFRIIGEIAEQLGMDWGGDWNDFVDRPHIQYLSTLPNPHIPDDYAMEFWLKSIEEGLNDGFGAKNMLQEQQLMTILGRFMEKYIK